MIPSQPQTFPSEFAKFKPLWFLNVMNIYTYTLFLILSATGPRSHQNLPQRAKILKSFIGRIPLFHLVILPSIPDKIPV